jgi:hypothetical protein
VTASVSGIVAARRGSCASALMPPRPARSGGAGGPVHHHEGAPEPIFGAAGGPDLRRREATARHLGLNERFLAGQGGVGHHPDDEVAVKARRGAGEAERHQLRPETPVSGSGGAANSRRGLPVAVRSTASSRPGSSPSTS